MNPSILHLFEQLANSVHYSNNSVEVTSQLKKKFDFSSCDVSSLRNNFVNSFQHFADGILVC